MDQQMNCPPWLDRLPGWSKNCDDIHNMQLHHIQEKHHHLQQISSPTNNSSNALNRLYANLHHLPTDIKLSTVEVPPPSNIHRYTTLRTSISEQSQANQYLSTELTSLPPEKEQYAQVLRHAIAAAHAHAAHLLGTEISPHRLATSQNTMSFQASPPNKTRNHRNNRKRNNTSPRKKQHKVSSNNMTMNMNMNMNVKQTTVRASKRTLRPSERVRKKVAGYRDNETKRVELLKRTKKTIHSCNVTSLAQALETVENNHKPSIETRQKLAKDRYETYWKKKMHARNVSMHTNSAAAWDQRLKTKRDKLLFVAIVLMSRSKKMALKLIDQRDRKERWRINRSTAASSVSTSTTKMRSLDPIENAGTLKCISS